MDAVKAGVGERDHSLASENVEKANSGHTGRLTNFEIA